MADILIGNEEDFQLCLGFQGPEAGGRNLAEKIGNFKEMVERDYQDTHRAASPLTRADDAVLVDSSDLTLEQSVARMKALALEAIGNRH